MLTLKNNLCNRRMHVDGNYVQQLNSSLLSAQSR